jgi:hypothetical protein
VIEVGEAEWPGVIWPLATVTELSRKWTEQGEAGDVVE